MNKRFFFLFFFFELFIDSLDGTLPNLVQQRNKRLPPNFPISTLKRANTWKIHSKISFVWIGKKIYMILFLRHPIPIRRVVFCSIIPLLTESSSSRSQCSYHLLRRPIITEKLQFERCTLVCCAGISYFCIWLSLLPNDAALYVAQRVAQTRWTPIPPQPSFRSVRQFDCKFNGRVGGRYTNIVMRRSLKRCREQESPP